MSSTRFVIVAAAGQQQLDNTKTDNRQRQIEEKEVGSIHWMLRLPEWVWLVFGTWQTSSFFQRHDTAMQGVVGIFQ